MLYVKEVSMVNLSPGALLRRVAVPYCSVPPILVSVGKMKVSLVNVKTSLQSCQVLLYISNENNSKLTTYKCSVSAVAGKKTDGIELQLRQH